MKFDANLAKSSLGKPETPTPATEQASPLYRRYFDLATGEPIALESITKRIQKRFSEIDRLSVEAMLDLYFVHQNWTTFYDRQDSFQNYLNEEVQISKSHAYGILHGVSLLEEYYSQQNQTTDAVSFLNDIATTLESVGIRKLREISNIKDSETKHTLLSKLLSGEPLSTQDILTEKRKRTPPKAEDPGVYCNTNAIYLRDARIVTIEAEDEGLTAAVCKAVKRYYRNS